MSRMDHLKYLTAILAMLDDRDLTIQDFAAMLFLEKHGQQKVGAIRDGINVHGAQMSRILHHLEDRGLVERQIGDDVRTFLISLTQRGEEESSNCIGRLEQALR